MNIPVEYISTEGKQLLAILIRHEYEKDGIEFFTDHELSQQLAYMKRPQGYTMQAHVHKSVAREVQNTLETLFIKSGVVKVELYDDKKAFITDRLLYKGDVILLVAGGHGFEIVETAEIIEVKQGPFAGDHDKERF